MKSISIYNITGLDFPYTIYACDIYGNNCILIATITTSVPPSNSILLPPQFDSAPSLGIKIITSDNCERFHTLNCSVPKKYQFQDYEDFEFMDFILYDFQN
jgi:hypothetical protein